ncbi:MAG TPA: MinD/ParA family protein [Gammaproteobacteria bacterium]|nr:MinD/ParA family protein [Gammaproteobacteria bacterium]
MKGIDPQAAGHSATVIAITSGKGGVGKSNVAANLAITLAQSNARVVLLDMDLGLANAHVLLGMSSQASLGDVLAGTKSIEEVAVPGPGNITVVPGGAADEELANLSSFALRRLLNSLKGLCRSFDYVIIDTAAGLSRNTLSFATASDVVVVVTTPEPTALLDAYAVFKSLKTTSDPTLHLLINMARTPQEGKQAIRRLDTVIRSFWHVPLENTHCVPFDGAIGDAVRARRPVNLAYPNCPAARSIRAFGEKILHQDVPNHGCLQNEQSLLGRLFQTLSASV